MPYRGVAPAFTDLMGGRTHAIVGAGMFCSALGSAIEPWLAGWQFDVTGSYAMPFLVAAVCAAVSGVAVWVAWRLRVGEPRR